MMRQPRATIAKKSRPFRNPQLASPNGSAEPALHDAKADMHIF
jgi:hypothetical protein